MTFLPVMKSRFDRRHGAPPALALVVTTLCTVQRAGAEELPPKAPNPTNESAYTSHGLFGPVRVGPSVGIGAPEGVHAALVARAFGLVSAGIAGGYIPPTRLPVVDAQVQRVSGEGFLRLHPLRGAFFVGAAGGYTQTKGTIAQSTVAFHQTQTAEAHAYAGATYIAPQMGWVFVIPPGLTLGFDAGAEIPVASTGPTFDVAKYGLTLPVEGKGDLADAMRYLTTGVIPVAHFDVGFVL